MLFSLLSLYFNRILFNEVFWLGIFCFCIEKILLWRHHQLSLFNNPYIFRFYFFHQVKFNISIFFWIDLTQHWDNQYKIWNPYKPKRSIVFMCIFFAYLFIEVLLGKFNKYWPTNPIKFMFDDYVGEVCHLFMYYLKSIGWDVVHSGN